MATDDSLHRWTLLPEHSTKGGRAERVEEEGDYSTEKGEESKGISGDGSGTSGASTSGDDEFSGGGADGTSAAEEDGGGWRQMKRHQRRRGGCKVRERRKGGQERQAGKGDGAVILTEHITGDGDNTNEAPRLRR